MAQTSSVEQAPVVIVGAGPVGLALAGDLGWRGVSCVLIERGDGQVFQPKMDMVGIRTMEFCRRWGIADDVENAGYNRDYSQDYAWVSQLYGGYEFGRESFPTVRDEPKPEQSPQKRERCPQNFFDPVLTRFAGKTAMSRSRLHRVCLASGERRRGDCAGSRTRWSGEEREMACQYLVGCDGGASRVKESLGIRMTGTPALTYTTNAIIECNGLRAVTRQEARVPLYLHRSGRHLEHAGRDQRAELVAPVHCRRRDHAHAFRGRRFPGVSPGRGP